MRFEDLIINHLGEFGRYQKIQFFLVCLPSMFTAMHALSWTFSAASVPHRCRTVADPPTNANFWSNHTGLFTAACDPKTDSGHSLCVRDACKLPDGQPCPNGFIYDRSEITYSAIDRWDIVCDRSVLKAVIQSTYYIGQMIGSVVFGYLGDRIGRKKVFFVAIILQIVSGLSMVLAPHWTVFGVLRAGVGFAHPGIFVIAVVIGMELVGPSKRKIASVFTGIFFSFGQMSLGLLAYFIRDYQYLQLAIAAPALVFLTYWWLVPESARWLVSQRRYNDADEIVQRAARMNKTAVPEKWWEQLEEDTVRPPGDDDKTTRRKTYGFLDLLRTPKIRKISLGIFFCWPVVSMVYYGVSMNTNFLGGDLYKTFIFGALMEVPAVLTVFFLVDRIGRKALLAGGFTIASLCMISNLIIHDAHWMVTMAQFLIAKGSITATYATIYTFTPELFPTVIRNTAMGICSMMARVGAICASYIAMWLVDDYGKIAMILPFASLGLCAAVVIVLLLPETKGRNLAETIEEVEGKVRAHELEPLQPQAAAAADETALPGAATNPTNSSAFAPAAQQPLTAKPEEKSA
ncbi:Organic cation transporter protein [Aphelenchoides fujianensis]|nr:Organic cation transporter protein [Aphelenchoides fujianensis]